MGSIDPCPVCGRDDFGNEGARARHVESCGPNRTPENQVQRKPTPPEPANQSGELAREQDVQPASGTEQIGAGVAAALDSDAPVGDRVEGVKQVGSLVTDVVGGAMKQREHKQRQQRQNAQNTGLERADDYPECEECGATFVEIPQTADIVECPECGAAYRTV